MTQRNPIDYRRIEQLLDGCETGDPLKEALAKMAAADPVMSKEEAVLRLLLDLRQQVRP